MGSVFVGLLFFIGGFLIAYTGDTGLENWGSTIAGVSAFGIALFPTSGSGCEQPATFLSRVFVEVTNPEPYTVAEATGIGQRFFEPFGSASDYHFAFAGVVFVYLGLFCIFVLRRVLPSVHGEGEGMLQTKRNRNVLYLLCGVVILICVALLALKSRFFDVQAWDRLNLTFWVELVALWAFGLAWMTKGRIFPQLND